MNKFKISELISTFFYIGKIKYCPSTLASFIAHPLAIALVYTLYNIIAPLVPKRNGDGFVQQADIWTLIFFSFSIITLLLFIMGIYSSKIYINNIGQDHPKEIVIDKVVGQILTSVLSFPIFVFMVFQSGFDAPLLITSYCSLCFISFRLYDIFKPWPINSCNKNIKGGWGVMLDDVIAALFASTTNYVIIYLIKDYF